MWGNERREMKAATKQLNWKTKWPLKRVKYLATCNDEVLPENTDAHLELEYLDIGNVTPTGVITGTELITFKSAPARARRRVRHGDIIVSTVRTYLRAITRIDNPSPNLVVSTGFAVVRPGKEIDARFLGYSLRSKEFVDEVVARSTGVSYPAISATELIKITAPLPPPPEQRRIADFLDRETDKIDRLIAEKEQMLGLLEEKRLAITNNSLQMSGTQLMRFGLVAERMNRAVQIMDEDEYTPVGLYNYGRGMFHKLATKGRDLGDSSFFYIEAGDLVLSGQFAWEGAVALARKEDAGCVASHRYPVFKARPNMAHPGYLISFFRTDTGHMLLNHHSRGAAGRNRPLNDRTLAKEKIPVPPMPIQRQIGKMLEQEIRLREEVLSSNTLLRERRAALISAAVSGRLDVREDTV